MVNSTKTDISGSYEISDVNTDQIVLPYKNDEVRKGVNIADVARIRRHYLQISQLNSDYKMIAADVNRDQKIDIVDVAITNRVYLQKATNFPNNTSWRFLPKDLDISSNPLSPLWNEYIDLNQSSLDFNALDFVSIKTGDVDNSALFKKDKNKSQKRTTSPNNSDS